MSESNLPVGWDEDRIRKVLRSYDAETEDEASAADEAGVEYSETVMNVPRDLVPKVRQLIANHRE